MRAEHQATRTNSKRGRRATHALPTNSGECEPIPSCGGRVPGERGAGRERGEMDAVLLLLQTHHNFSFPRIFGDEILRDATTERTLNCAGEFCQKLSRNCAKLYQKKSENRSALQIFSFSTFRDTFITNF